MGTCNSTGRSRAFTIDELADLPLGEKKEMGNGCGPSVNGTQGGSCYARLVQRGFAWPDNGEFNWGGMGSSCNMCSDASGGYGCDNCKGSKAVGGHRGTVKRIAYLGDRSECCKQQKRIINGKTCDPKYLKNYQDDACDIDMKDYCVGETLTKEECQKWVHTALDQNRSAPNISLREYCSQGTNFNNQVCQQWCDKVKNKSTMSGECDQAVANYCQKNATDVLCTCINPPENVTKAEGLISSAKVCWYRACKDLANDNYITSTMRDQKKNCVSTVCTIDAGDIQVSGTNNQIEFKNECASNILKPVTKEEEDREAEKEAEKQEIAELVEQKEASADKNTSESKYSTIIKVIMTILTCIFLIIAVISFIKSKIIGSILMAISIILFGLTIYIFVAKNENSQ